MPIPKTREDTITMVTTSFTKLMAELEGKDADIASVHCVDGWSIKDVLAIRSWWTTSVADWIETGDEGDEQELPAKGYTWQETPRLNSDIVKRSQSRTYEQIVSDLQNGFNRVMMLIDRLDDKELLQPGVFAWAGKWPIARWISINTARQYTTARTFIRRALRE